MKISENTNVTLDLKTIGMIVGFATMIAGTYYTLQGQYTNCYGRTKARSQ